MIKSLVVGVVRGWGSVLFVGFIVSQPLIDIATGLSTWYFNSVVSPGALIRTLLLLFLVPYIWKELAFRPFMRTLFMSTIGTIMLTATISILIKQPFLFTQEAVFTMKALYFVVSLFFIIVLFKKPLSKRSDVRLAIVFMSFLMSGSYYVALLTKTSFPSYPYGEIGFSGWFFSANELSVIVVLVFASVMMIGREQPGFFSISALFSLAGMAMLIGTKTAYMGVAILLAITLIELIWTYKGSLFRSKQAFVYLFLALAFMSFLPFAPMTENRSYHAEQATYDQGLHIDPLQGNEPAPMNNILSSRQDYIQKIATDFSRAPLIRKLFGLGYAGDYVNHPKMIEMDFFELLFSFGGIGTIILLIPLLYIGFLILSRTSFAAKNWVLLAGLGLTIAIAAVAGHVLFAPSVMSYVIISAALLKPKDQWGSNYE